MNHLRKITKIVANLLTIMLLFVLGLVIYGKAVTTFTDNNYPDYFGYTFFEVASGSMKPTLQINDVILVKITQEDLKKNDIIAFENENTIVTHRIMFMEGNIITVKGDSNDVVDKPIKKEQVIGKVVKIFPSLGIWKKVLTDPKILLAIFITLIIFDFVLSYDGKNKIKEVVENRKDKGKEAIKKQPIDEPLPVKEEKNIEEKEVKKEKKNIEPESLLELTRKINIDEINSLLEGTEYKLQKREINNIKRVISRVEEKKSTRDVEAPKLTENEKNALAYTMRLDLSEIQKIINSKVK